MFVLGILYTNCTKTIYFVCLTLQINKIVYLVVDKPKTNIYNRAIPNKSQIKKLLEDLKMKVKKLLKYYEGKYIIWQIDIVCTNDSTKKEYNKIKNKKVLFCQCDDSTLHIDI